MFKTRNRKDAEILQQESIPIVSIVNVGRNPRPKAGESTIKEIGFDCDEKEAIEILKRRKKEDLKARLEEEGTASTVLLLEQEIKELKEEKAKAKKEEEKEEEEVTKKRGRPKGK